MSAVALPSVTSVKVSGDTSLHFVKAMPMAFLVSSTFRVLGNLMILRWKRQTDNWTLIGPQRMMLRPFSDFSCVIGIEIQWEGNQ